MNYSHVYSKEIPLKKILDDLGANNGLFQSNTAFFEKECNCTRILIEPSLKGYQYCSKRIVPNQYMY